MISSNALSFCFASTSFYDSTLRSLAYTVLQNFQKRLKQQNEYFRQKLLFGFFIEFFKNSILSVNQKACQCKHSSINFIILMFGFLDKNLKKPETITNILNINLSDYFFIFSCQSVLCQIFKNSLNTNKSIIFTFNFFLHSKAFYGFRIYSGIFKIIF